MCYMIPIHILSYTACLFTEFAVVDQTTPRIFAKSIHINYKLKLNTIIISAQYRITNITTINL